MLPVVVMVTVDEEANCLDGASPETAAARIASWGVDAIGCNCSVGPATVLTAIERMAAATTLPLMAMPNAGMPRSVDGRNIYLCSPEYMASFARKFTQGRRAVCRRLLRNDAAAHPGDEVGAARDGSAGCGATDDKERADCDGDASGAD